MLTYRDENGDLLLPPETHPKLIEAYRNFFYAGGRHLLRSLIYDAALDEGDKLTEDDTSKIDALEHEINEYFSKLSREGVAVN